MIKTKSAYELPDKSDGERILISRYWPRGLSKERLSIEAWLKELAPSKELLMDWKTEKITWQEYEKRYLKEMSAQKEKINILSEKTRHGTITLLCFEKEENPYCHRHLLKKLIEQEGSS